MKLLQLKTILILEKEENNTIEGHSCRWLISYKLYGLLAHYTLVIEEKRHDEIRIVTERDFTGYFQLSSWCNSSSWI
jgi:hypothetical protein